MADKYDPIADLAELVVAVLGYNTTDPAHYAGRVTMRLRISEDESVQAVAAALRKALGLGTRAVTYDMADWDTYTVLTLALEELAASQRERARDIGGDADDALAEFHAAAAHLRNAFRIAIGHERDIRDEITAAGVEAEYEEDRG